MTLGIVRGLITLALFVSFIALWIWAWRGERATTFAAAARLPLEDDCSIHPGPANESTSA